MSVTNKIQKMQLLLSDLRSELTSLGFTVASDAKLNDIEEIISSIEKKSSTDLTASGAKVTVPAGFYKVDAEKSISSGSAKPPSSISGSSATATRSGTTVTFTKTISVTPTVSAGYISSGTAQNTTVVLSATDANFVASNIKSGVSIFGLTGSYSDSSVTLSGDASEADVRLNKTFYSNSTTKKTGSMPDSDIKNNSYIQIDDTYNYGIDFTAGYTAAHSIKGFNVPQDATMYVNDMDQESTLYVFSGDGDVYVGERGDDPSDCVLIASAGTVRKTNMTIDQYASGARVYTVTPGTANTLVKVGTGFIEQQYVQVNGDTNLKASNIKKGATIFGVEGIYEGGGTTSASWSSSITLSTNASDGYQPLVVTAGQTNVNYLMSLTIDSGKKVESVYIDGTLRDLWCGSSSEISSLRGDVTIKGSTATTSYALGTGGALSIKEYGSTTEYQIASAGKININNLSSKNLRKGVTILNVSAVSYAPDYGSMNLSANCRYVTITNNSNYTLRYIYSTATGTNSSGTVNSGATSGRLNAGSAYASIYQGICITTYGTNNVVLTFYSASSGGSEIQTITLSGYRHYVIRMSSSSYSSARTLYWYGI